MLCGLVLLRLLCFVLFFGGGDNVVGGTDSHTRVASTRRAG